MSDVRYEDERYSLSKLSRALLVGAHLIPSERDLCLEHLKELAALCDTYGFEAIGAIPCSIKSIDVRTYIGSGKVAEIAERESDLVIFDEELSPVQQRNLEKALGRPVIDRTELILEVFAKRAQTKEAQLQIELATRRYQLPRLTRLWTHLGRQTGTSGGKGAYLKGAGERQIELDRRAIRRRVTQLRRELVDVRKQRALQRTLRERSGIPTFAIVGYTNAGKSTLLNRLTGSDVLAEDALFATLDTTTRSCTLPNNQECLLVDTVGFIRKIPHHLVEAFKSTLEEAVQTDILLHLIDVSHPMAEEQAAETCSVLSELGAGDRPIITVCNKVDISDAPLRLHKLRLTYPKMVAISAATGEGIPELLEMMERECAALRRPLSLRIPQSDYSRVAHVMEVGHVIATEYDGDDVLLTADIPTRYIKEFEPYVETPSRD
jgi:GTP-binding protein HflX